jgi:hypothetical protein
MARLVIDQSNEELFFAGKLDEIFSIELETGLFRAIFDDDGDLSEKIEN